MFHRSRRSSVACPCRKCCRACAGGWHSFTSLGEGETKQGHTHTSRKAHFLGALPSGDCLRADCRSSEWSSPRVSLSLLPWEVACLHLPGKWLKSLSTTAPLDIRTHRRGRRSDGASYPSGSCALSSTASPFRWFWFLSHIHLHKQSQTNTHTNTLRRHAGTEAVRTHAEAPHGEIVLPPGQVPTVGRRWQGSVAAVRTGPWHGRSRAHPPFGVRALRERLNTSTRVHYESS